MGGEGGKVSLTAGIHWLRLAAGDGHCKICPQLLWALEMGAGCIFAASQWSLCGKEGCPVQARTRVRGLCGEPPAAPGCAARSLGCFTPH